MVELKFGLPCSRLKDRIQDVDIHCTSEEEAMGIAAGCILGGENPVVYMQNSGLCRILDVCGSLYIPYGIRFPSLLLSVRKQPVHHRFAGENTRKILEMLDYDDVVMVEEECIS